MLTINHYNYGWHGPGSSKRNEKDFDQGEIIQLDIDISLPRNLDAVISRITDADLIRFNLADGLLLQKILGSLGIGKNDGQMIMVIEKIGLKSISPVLHEISMPRIDLTSFGHACGIGLVHWSNIS